MKGYEGKRIQGAEDQMKWKLVRVRNDDDDDIVLLLMMI